MFETIRNGINKKSMSWLILLLFFLILIIDRTITLCYFGFVYTDIDQLIMWNGAVDYSNGIFHEPFFYGQPYNYMLESILAVPLLYANVPIYMALPIASSIISLFPFIILALALFKKQKYFLAYLCLAIPVFLPLQFNFLTTISRGFVQAHLFIPLLFIPLFNPESKKNTTILFLVSAICFIANQSSALIIFPVITYVSSYHYKSISFYIKALWVIPLFIIDFLFKYYYQIHPEKVLHNISGIRLDGQTFIDSVSNANLFEYLFPFSISGGFIYPLIFVILAIIAFKKEMKKEFLFIVSIIFIILISFAIPKVQGSYPIENAGIFFSVSRFYLTLPLLVIISSYLIFKKLHLKIFLSFILLGICIISLFIKNNPIQNTVNETIAKTSFPIAKNQDLLLRANKLKTLSLDYDIDLIVHKMYPSWCWDNLFDSYALYPLAFYGKDQNKEVISVNLNGDRRSWLYEKSEFSKQILLIGFTIDETQLEGIEYDVIDENHLLINNNNQTVKTLLKKLNFEYGNL